MINLSHLLPQDLIVAMSLVRFQEGSAIKVDNGNTHSSPRFITARVSLGLLV